VALCPFLKPEAIVATNTSSVHHPARAATDRRALHRLHFMNPVPVMELVR
jgi:3-hydroxybutyryl-CoA dehydrogenase